MTVRMKIYQATKTLNLSNQNAPLFHTRSDKNSLQIVIALFLFKKKVLLQVDDTYNGNWRFIGIFKDCI